MTVRVNYTTLLTECKSIAGPASLKSRTTALSTWPAILAVWSRVICSSGADKCDRLDQIVNDRRSWKAGLSASPSNVSSPSTLGTSLATSFDATFNVWDAIGWIRTGVAVRDVSATQRSSLSIRFGLLTTVKSTSRFLRLHLILQKKSKEKIRTIREKLF